MKNPLPNSLQRELANSTPIGPHPDADLLTAFAEGTLTEHEREGVFGHLATCAYCREVVSTASAAAPASPEAAALEPKRPTKAPFRGWLPWAASATAIVVVGSAVIHHQSSQKPYEPPSTGTARFEAVKPLYQQNPPSIQNKAQREEPVPPEADGSPAAPTRTAPNSRSTGTENKLVAPRKRAEIANDSTEATSEARDQALKKQPTNSRALAGSVLQSPLGDKKANSGAVSGIVANAPAAKPAAPSRGYDRAMKSTANAANSFGESAASGAAHNNAAGARGRPHWRIDDAGHLQRSFGRGEWQTMLNGEATRFHVISVVGSDVWAGGENLRLYHSADNGATWQAVILPAKDSGSTTITRIHFDTAETAKVETEGGATWITTDAGRTWR